MTAVAPPERGLDLSPPLRRALSQGLVMLDSEATAADGRLTRVVDWLLDWDSALLDDWGIPRGAGLHGLYGRAVTFSGALPLWRHRDAAVAELGRLAARGIGVSIEAPVLTPDDDLAAVLGFLGALAPASVVIRLEAASDGRARDDDSHAEQARGTPPAPEAARAQALGTLVPAVAQRHSVVLVGDPDGWARLGILARPELSAAQISIIPADTGGYALSADGLRAGRHGLTSPCVGRFRAVVAPDDHVYPCLGLVGHPGARLGSLGEPARRRAQRMDLALQTWAVQGPWRSGSLDPLLDALSGPSSAGALADVARLVADGLPPVCAAHVATFLEPPALPAAGATH